MAGVFLVQGWAPDDFLNRYSNEMKRCTPQYQQTSTGQTHLKTLASMLSFHSFLRRTKSVLLVLALLDPENIKEDILTTKLALAQLHGFPTNSIDLKED